MKINSVISRSIIVILSFLIVFAFNVNQSLAQKKADPVSSRAEKLQKMLGLSDVQKAKVVDILNSVKDKDEMPSEDGGKTKIKFGKHTDEINTAIEQILTVDQVTKFNEIKTSWLSNKGSKKESSDEDSTKVKKDKSKKEMKSNKNES